MFLQTGLESERPVDEGKGEWERLFSRIKSSFKRHLANYLEGKGETVN